MVDLLCIPTSDGQEAKIFGEGDEESSATAVPSYKRCLTLKVGYEKILPLLVY